jgi:hypothetical protein
LSRTKEAPEKTAEEDSEEDGAQQQKTVTKRASRAATGNTLVSKASELNLRKLDLEFAIDPLFCKASASFDDHGGRGLLLSHLSVYNGSFFHLPFLCPSSLLHFWLLSPCPSNGSFFPMSFVFLSLLPPFPTSPLAVPNGRSSLLLYKPSPKYFEFIH